MCRLGRLAVWLSWEKFRNILDNTAEALPFGQAGSGSGGFKAGSLPRYLIQRFRALFRLCAIGRRALLFGGDGAAAMRFNTFSRWTTSDDFI